MGRPSDAKCTRILVIQILAAIQNSLPETTKAPLKIGHPKKFIVQPSIFQGRAVSFREGIWHPNFVWKVIHHDQLIMLEPPQFLFEPLKDKKQGIGQDW